MLKIQTYNNTLNTPFTPTGIPFVWDTGDSVTATSGRVNSIGSGYGEELGYSLAIGSGKIFAGYAGKTTYAIYNGINGQNFNRITQYQTTSTSPAVQNNFGANMKFRNGYLVLSDESYSSGGAKVNEGRLILKDTSGSQQTKFFYGSISNAALGSLSLSIGSGLVIGSVKKYNATDGAEVPTYVDVFDLKNGITNTSPSFTLSNPGGTVTDYFGFSCDVSDGRIVVGAPRNATAGDRAGAIHIFNSGGTLIKTKYGDSSYNYLGYSVAVGNGLIVASAPFDLSYDNGYVNVYDLNGNFIRKITCPDTNSLNYKKFGFSVAVGSGRILVGAISNSSNLPLADRYGYVYVFDLDGKLIERLDAPSSSPSPTSQMCFGYKVAINEDMIAVSAPFSGATVVGLVSMFRTPWNITATDIPELRSVGQKL